MIDTLNKIIDHCKNLKVLVIGETIVDEFIEVSYEGQSMKSFCPVFRLSGSKVQRQQGGAAAIANHLKDFVADVKIITNTSDEIVKTRYIDVSSGKKHIEINKFNNGNFPEITVNTHDYDVVIVADFGHGFCDKLCINEGFYVMAQTNSNNFGFNRVSKWKGINKKGVCIDLREASLQMNKRIHHNDHLSIKELHDYELHAKDLFVTIGSEGALFYNGDIFVEQPSFKSDIVDTIGAGDSFYGFSCLVSAIQDKVPIQESIFVPALAASLTTTWLCNEQNVTKKKLLEYAYQFI